jgi:hypothetical protein
MIPLRKLDYIAVDQTTRGGVSGANSSLTQLASWGDYGAAELQSHCDMSSAYDLHQPRVSAILRRTMVSESWILCRTQPTSDADIAEHIICTRAASSSTTRGAIAREAVVPAVVPKSHPQGMIRLRQRFENNVTSSESPVTMYATPEGSYRWAAS